MLNTATKEKIGLFLEMSFAQKKAERAEKNRLLSEEEKLRYRLDAAVAESNWLRQELVLLREEQIRLIMKQR